MKLFSGGRNAFVFSGIIFLMLVIVFIVVIFSQPSKDFVKTSAVISEIREYEEYDEEGSLVTKQEFYVDYDYNGKEYRHVHLDIGSSFMKKGQTVDVYVNPEKPYEIRSNTTAAIYIVGALALAMLAVTVVMLVRYIKAKKEESKENTAAAK